MRAMTDRFAELITAYLRKHALDHKVFAKAGSHARDGVFMVQG